MELHFENIARVIQLATAPVFLLAAVGSVLIVLTNRLARIIDRSRILGQRLREQAADEDRAELASLHRRATLINLSIAASTVCGLLICLVIALLFVGATAGLPLDGAIALCFVLSMVALMAGLIYFLREIFICCAFISLQQLAFLAGR